MVLHLRSIASRCYRVGTAYGVLVKELRLLARAIFVVGKDGVVKHAEIVPEMTHHPDYEKALAAAR